MAATPIALMVVGDDAEARSSLAARLSEEPSCVVIGAFGSDDVWGATAGSQEPDVIVWDLGDDPEGGLPRLADAQEWRVPIVAIVQDDRDAIGALAAGAAGLLARPVDPERVVLAARTVLGGLLALDPSVAEFAGAQPPARDERRPGGRGGVHDAPVEQLTRREHEVLRLMAQGLGNKQIAERLGITEHTVKFHVHTVLGKLSTQSRTEAVVRAARLGLIAI
ncbi:MAG TPA: response regulator transcription factor [bacterium]|nr:response regulator transcription factor [bacterium]